MSVLGTIARSAALVIVGNGPGEVAGWALPIAAETRRWAAEQDRSIEVDLCLPPCQFASGQEQSVATAAGVFDHIVDPKATLRLGLGLSGWTPSAPTVVLHVGGDFWYSRRLARRWGARAFAFVERSHVSRTHRAYDRIFVPTPDIADLLARGGVPADKVLVTGDPRHDALLVHPAKADTRNGDASSPTITFLAGSRDTAFSACFPFWVQTAAALRARLPDARCAIVISPYVSPAVHRALVAQHRGVLEAGRVEVRYGGLSDVSGSDLVLTIPGSNTMELALMRMPSIVVVPTNHALQIPTEGIVEWVTRLPRIGPHLRLFLLRRALQRTAYVALPNIRARRRIMPELIGDVTPQDVADESARLLGDEEALGRLARDLEAIAHETGASRRIVAAMSPGWARA